jgi:hypothetical protein
MAAGTNDPKDLGSQKINNQGKTSERNEGFSGENLPKNYDPAATKLKTELDKDKDGSTEVVKRARDVEEKKASPVSQSEKAIEDNGEVVSKSRGTKNEAEDQKTAENRDFNSDINEKRYPSSHPDNKKQRGNINPGK